MRLLRMLLMRVRAVLRAGIVDAELDVEMREHFDRLVEEHLARGCTLEAARAAAHREFGPLTQLTEQAREARGVAWVLSAAHDVRYGLRLMRRAPGFAAAVVLTI